MLISHLSLAILLGAIQRFLAATYAHMMMSTQGYYYAINFYLVHIYPIYAVNVIVPYSTCYYKHYMLQTYKFTKL